jgi:hypothetical protein
MDVKIDELKINKYWWIDMGASFYLNYYATNSIVYLFYIFLAFWKKYCSKFAVYKFCYAT